MIFSLLSQERDGQSGDLSNEETFLLTVFKFEGEVGISENYLLRYGRLKLAQRYTAAALQAWTARYKSRLESDIRIDFVKPDLFFSSEKKTVELYILIEPNSAVVNPSGENAYMSFTFLDSFIKESLLTVYAGYNRQSVLWNIPYISLSNFGVQFSGGHHIQNHFDFRDNIYSDFFLQKYFYWHPLPEVRIGVYQQLDAVFYYNGYQGNRDLLGRWQLGLRLQAHHEAMENEFGYDLDGEVGWRPLGQFRQELSSLFRMLLYGHFGWFRPYLELEYGQVSVGGETKKSFVPGSRKKGLLLRSAFSLDLIFLPFPALFTLFDVGFISGSSIGIGSDSWEHFNVVSDFEHTVFLGPYFVIISPGIGIGVRLALISDDFWSSNNFAWSLTISGM